MRGRFIIGMTAGTIMGLAAGMMMPDMDRGTRRRMRRTGRYMRDMAEGAYDGMRNMMK